MIRLFIKSNHLVCGTVGGHVSYGGTSCLVCGKAGRLRRWHLPDPLLQRRHCPAKWSGRWLARVAYKVGAYDQCAEILSEYGSYTASWPSQIVAWNRLFRESLIANRKG